MGIARGLGAASNLTKSALNGLDRQVTKGINRSVQTKNPLLLGADSKAEVIPITRPSAPDFGALKE